VIRLLAWLAGAIGVARIAKALRTRHEPLSPPAGPDPRAEELRRKLERQEPEPEPVVDEPPAEPQQRTREDVHAKARAAIAEMQSSGDEPIRPE
jgi:hypothetical protein